MSSRILSDGHWTMEKFTQRITTKQWKEILLNEDDKFIARGYLRQLSAKRLGAGVVEVSKNPIKEFS